MLEGCSKKYFVWKATKPLSILIVEVMSNFKQLGPKLKSQASAETGGPVYLHQF